MSHEISAGVRNGSIFCNIYFHRPLVDSHPVRGTVLVSTIIAIEYVGIVQGSHTSGLKASLVQRTTGCCAVFTVSTGKIHRKRSTPLILYENLVCPTVSYAYFFKIDISSRAPIVVMRTRYISIRVSIVNTSSKRSSIY